MQSNQKFKLSVFDHKYINPLLPLPPQLEKWRGKSVKETIVTLEAPHPNQAFLMYLHGHLFKFKDVLTKFAIIVIVEKPQGKADFIIMDTRDYLTQCDPAYCSEMRTLH